MRQGADPNHVQVFPQHGILCKNATALRMASGFGHGHAVTLLIERGAKADRQTEEAG